MASSGGGVYTARSAARNHIERMRREKYYIGKRERNQLEEDIQYAVNYLSEELYSKDAHFLMELIQNAEDNEYPAGVEPSLEFVITTKDITATGAESTLLVFNNEKGFSPANIDCLCGIGKSTKKGNRHLGYIGEKGIGFKSVFLVSGQPYIFSNGYQIRFNEEPCKVCNIAYIVPEWVEENPSRSDIQSIYGSSTRLPKTTIILPLRSEKVMSVQQQLSSIHPEVLLFLSKIKRLSVKERNTDPMLNTVNQISIRREIDFLARNNAIAESFTLHLVAQENDNDEEDECSYYMWRQRFPVKPENRVKKRMEINEWVITLAFPHSRRLNRGMRSPGVYAFLPTEMVTNFPFIIQADFLLAASRESMFLDSPWNKGILDCVPSAFVDAFVSYIKLTINVSSFPLLPVFKFLPLNKSLIELMDSVRHTIKLKLLAERIIPCESYTKQNIFGKPCVVHRLAPAFRDILIKARKMGVNLENLSFCGTYILSSSFDNKEHDKVLEFLGVQYVDKEWYVNFIEASNLPMEVPEQVYIDLLCFIAYNWDNYFCCTNIGSVPLIKYEYTNGMVYLSSIQRATQQNKRLYLASDVKYISWLISSNRELVTTSNHFFLPRNTQTMLHTFSRRRELMEWLKKFVKVEVVDVYDYAILLLKALSNRKDVITFTHFLYHSLQNKWLSDLSINDLCCYIPLVDNYGQVISQRTEILVPAKGSKWARLIGSNPWRKEVYVELGADYLSSGSFAGLCTKENQLLLFLQSHIQVSDIPNLRPPDAEFPIVFSPLTVENAFALLEWIQHLRYKRVHLPEKFLGCIKKGSWLKTSLSHKSPSESFLSSSKWGNLLQMESVLVDIPIIDKRFYGDRITVYKDELKLMGVRFELEEALEYLRNHLMSLADNSTLTRSNIFTLLKLLRFMREKHLSPEHFINSLKDRRWLKTSHSYRSPGRSVLFNSEWTVASHISYLPFIDEDFYGGDIHNYKIELELLGVIVSFDHQLVVDNFKMPTTVLPADATILILECIRYVGLSEVLIKKMREIKWLKTHSGYKSPVECILSHSERLDEVVGDVPLIDEGFYGGRIRIYKEELKKFGVVISVEETSKVISHQFKAGISLSLVTKQNVIQLLTCARNMKERGSSFPDYLINYIHNEKWLRTRVGFRSPSDAILFDPDWEHISPIAALPFIDDSDSYYGEEIYEYKDELNVLGVVVEFKKGAHFILTCLKIPKDPSVMTPPIVFSLLKFIQNLKERRMEALPNEFLERISGKWLRTAIGYKSPHECLLFSSKWSSYLQREDGPFIDEAFYGLEITTYKEELKAIGVVVDLVNGRSLIVHHLKDHSEISVITRIYMYLSDFKWKPDNNDAEWILVQDESNKQKWVGSGYCVFHDKDNMFGSLYYVLENHYDPLLLSFFSMVLGVKHCPSMDDYFKLWKLWEAAPHEMTIAKCSAFWAYIANHWNSEMKDHITENITKLPVYTKCGIVLANKLDAFIPDDLLLEDLFREASQESIFIWYPETTRAKLNEIFRIIGARSISEAIEKEEPSSFEITGFRKEDARNSVMKNGLLKIVLAFLANSFLDICLEERHRVAQCLIDLDILETDDPVTVSYRLALSSGKVLAVRTTRTILWERANSKLIMQKIDMSCGLKVKNECATCLSEVIVEGLFDKESEIAALAVVTELIKMACLLDFEPEAVNMLLKSRNLQLFEEDEEFVSTVFPSFKTHCIMAGCQSKINSSGKRRKSDKLKTCHARQIRRPKRYDGYLY